MTDYSMVKPTKYAGITFRSRLEARWAVFFECMGYQWEYEPETFVVDGDMQYTPDFRIYAQWNTTFGDCGDGKLYAEVKPTDEALQGRSHVFGDAVEGGGPLQNHALAFLGPIPDWRRGLPLFWAIHWHKGPCGARISFGDEISGECTGLGGYPLPPRTSVNPYQSRDGRSDFSGLFVLSDPIAKALDAARHARFGLGGSQ